MIFTMVQDRKVKGMASFTMKFHTVHINGSTGAPSFGLHAQGMMSRQSVREDIVAYARENLYTNHPLMQAGWAQLPRNVFQLTAGAVGVH